MQVGYCVFGILGIFFATVAIDSESILPAMVSNYRGRLQTFFLVQAFVFTLLGPLCLWLYQ